MPRLSSWWWPVLAQVAVLVVAIVHVVPGAPALVPGCISVQVASSIEPNKVQVLQQFAEAYNDADHMVDDRCVEVSVGGTTSGIAMQAIRDGWGSHGTGGPEPQVWLPTSRMWLDLLIESGRVEGLTEGNRLGPIAQSLLVVAMPDPMARALGWPDQNVTWDDIAGLSEAGWGSRGHDQWGNFSFGKDQPRLSTSGLAATVATFDAAAQAGRGRRPGALQLDDVDDDTVLDFVQRVEAGVQRYDEDVIDSVENLARLDNIDSDSALGYFSAYLLQEQVAYEYNEGEYGDGDRDNGRGSPPEVKLRTFYPPGSTLVLDHPYVVLPEASDHQRAAAEDFHRYLRQREQRADLMAGGFRDADGGSGPGPLDEEVAGVFGVEEDTPVGSVVEPPSGEVVERVLDAWDGIRKPANVLLVVDTSESMTHALPNGRDRLPTMQDAVLAGLRRLLQEDHSVGLWQFPASESDQPYQQLVELGPLAGQRRDRIADAIRGLRAGRDSPLYDTIADAHQYLLDVPPPIEEGTLDPINAVVVLSDGGDSGSGSYDRARLVDELEASQPQAPGQPRVQVFTIAFGDDAELDVLREISDATGAEAYDARHLSHPLDEVILDVVSNF